jgi:hypothetical protein
MGSCAMDQSGSGQGPLNTALVNMQWTFRFNIKVGNFLTSQVQLASGGFGSETVSQIWHLPLTYCYSAATRLQMFACSKHFWKLLCTAVFGATWTSAVSLTALALILLLTEVNITQQDQGRVWWVGKHHSTMLGELLLHNQQLMCQIIIMQQHCL